MTVLTGNIDHLEVHHFDIVLTNELNDILGRFDLFGSDPKSLYALDAELGGRTYSAPSLTL